jgi:hypothetical protein
VTRRLAEVRQDLLTLLGARAGDGMIPETAERPGDRPRDPGDRPALGQLDRHHPRLVGGELHRPEALHRRRLRAEKADVAQMPAPGRRVGDGIGPIERGRDLAVAPGVDQGGEAGVEVAQLGDEPAVLDREALDPAVGRIVVRRVADDDGRLVARRVVARGQLLERTRVEACGRAVGGSEAAGPEDLDRGDGATSATAKARP